MPKAYHKKHLRLIFTYISFIFFSTLSTEGLAESIWQGPYIGAYLGRGYGSNNVSTNTGNINDASYFTNLSNMNTVNNMGTWSSNPQSTIAGIQMGHDWVWKQMVFGILFDYSALPLSSSSNINNLNYPDNSGQYSIYTSISTNWLFTLRGRIGYATTIGRPSFFYLTGGPALTQLKVNNNFNDTTSSAGAGGNQNFQNQIGWSAGAGLETIGFKRVSFYLEYLYLDFPSVKTTSSIYNTQGGFGISAQSMSSPFRTTGKFHANLIKIGLNYKFDEYPI